MQQLRAMDAASSGADLDLVERVACALEQIDDVQEGGAGGLAAQGVVVEDVLMEEVEDM